jgi:hypothetical protein
MEVEHGSERENSINQKPCRDAIYAEAARYLERVSTCPESPRKIMIPNHIACWVTLRYTHPTHSLCVLCVSVVIKKIYFSPHHLNTKIRLPHILPQFIIYLHQYILQLSIKCLIQPLETTPLSLKLSLVKCFPIYNCFYFQLFTNSLQPFTLKYS